MPERIDTKAVLADCLPPNPANYKSDFLCMTKALLQLETVRAALAQEIADREALEKRGFMWGDSEGIESLVVWWDTRPWLFRRNPDGNWLSIQPVTVTTREAALRSEEER